MLKKELAVALGISGAMVTKLAKRGMPTDTPERARRWRRRYLEPGRVKGFRSGTVAPAPPPAPQVQPPPAPSATTAPQPVDWLVMAAPDFVTVRTVEAVAAACAHLLENNPAPNEAAYPLAFLRDLLRRSDPNETRFQFPVCVWLHLVEPWIWSERISELRRTMKGGDLINAAALAPLVQSNPIELIDYAADSDGISVTGWPKDVWPPEDDPDEQFLTE